MRAGKKLDGFEGSSGFEDGSLMEEGLGLSLGMEEREEKEDKRKGGRWS